jgi:putative ABC transport system substrate-binding protein
MRRREFIVGLGTATAWPLAARAQQPKRVGVLMSRAAAEPWQSQLTIFMQGMRKLGWIEGQNLQTEVRWSAYDPSLIQAYATDLVGLFKPDVLVKITGFAIAYE